MNALDVQLGHLSLNQMLKQVGRQYFNLNDRKIGQRTISACDYPCQAAKILPKEIMEFKTETKPNSPGVYFNADVLVENKQKILVIRCNFSSFTDTTFIKNEEKETLRQELSTILLKLKLSNQVVVRVDSHSSLKSLKEDRQMKDIGITLEIGHPLNRNKKLSC